MPRAQAEWPKNTIPAVKPTLPTSTPATPVVAPTATSLEAKARWLQSSDAEYQETKSAAAAEFGKELGLAGALLLTAWREEGKLDATVVAKSAGHVVMGGALAFATLHAGQHPFLSMFATSLMAGLWPELSPPSVDEKLEEMKKDG